MYEVTLIKNPLSVLICEEFSFGVIFSYHTTDELMCINKIIRHPKYFVMGRTP
jgi:hypothetical protein